MNGIIYLAVGKPEYLTYTENSIRSLRKVGYKGAVKVIHDNDAIIKYDIMKDCILQKVMSGPGVASRQIKTQMNIYSPFQKTLYVDADTIFLKNPEPVWDEFRKEDIYMAVDICPTVRDIPKMLDKYKNELFRKENAYTYSVCVKEQQYFNAGVALWRKSAAVDLLFRVWNEEWKRYKNVDQMALARAVTRSKVKIGPLDKKYNYMPPGRNIEDGVKNNVYIFHYAGRPSDKFELKKITNIANYK